MKKYLFLISFLGTSCVTSMISPEVIKAKGKSKVYTLRMFTGKNGKDLYEESFWKKGESLCPEGFEIKETTNSPSTLNKELHSPYYYNWVIDCDSR